MMHLSPGLTDLRLCRLLQDEGRSIQQSESAAEWWLGDKGMSVEGKSSNPIRRLSVNLFVELKPIMTSCDFTRLRTLIKAALGSCSLFTAAFPPRFVSWPCLIVVVYHTIMWNKWDIICSCGDEIIVSSVGDLPSNNGLSATWHTNNE